MFSFKEIVENLPLPYKVKKNIIALEIAKQIWGKVVDKDFSQISRPFNFNDGTLFVEVPNHYYLQIMSSQTLEIINKLEKLTPEELRPLFKDLKFFINPSLEKTSKLKKNSDNLPKTQINFEEICKDVKDEELKTLFYKLLKAYAKTKKWIP